MFRLTNRGRSYQGIMGRYQLQRGYSKDIARQLNCLDDVDKTGDSEDLETLMLLLRDGEVEIVD